MSLWGREVFVLHALLDWHRNHETTLQVQHKMPSQALQWYDAITAHNIAMSGTGQPSWNHACHLCTKHLKDDHGNNIGVYRSVVTDGISLGHPCCTIHDCKEPLRSNHDYCALHHDAQSKCAVVTCQEPAEEGFRTCVLPNHHMTEEHYLDHGREMLQLNWPLAKLSGISKQDKNKELLDDAKGEEDLLDESGEVVDTCPEKPSGEYRNHLPGLFDAGHDEELCVAPCGVILGRPTFYGSQGPNSVRVSAFFSVMFTILIRCDVKVFWRFPYSPLKLRCHP